MKAAQRIIQLLCFSCILLAAHAGGGGVDTGQGRPADIPLGTPYIYKKLPDRDLHIYAVLPDGWTALDKRPTLVFFHGGGWIRGAPAVMNDQAAHFAAKGMVCFLVEYRLLRSGKDTPAACMRDARSAMRWVRGRAARFGVNPDRIAAGGGSAGAHLAASTALIISPDFDEPRQNAGVSHRPDALVLFNPVLDNGPGGFAHGRVGDNYRKYSPFHNVGPGAPPSIILSGSADKIVPVRMLRDFEAAMKNAGARCDVHIYEGQWHGFYRKFVGKGKYFDLTLSQIDLFFGDLGWL
jgi:acetyl esterase/lipase